MKWNEKNWGRSFIYFKINLYFHIWIYSFKAYSKRFPVWKIFRHFSSPFSFIHTHKIHNGANWQRKCKVFAILIFVFFFFFWLRMRKLQITREREKETVIRNVSTFTLRSMKHRLKIRCNLFYFSKRRCHFSLSISFLYLFR